MVLLSPSDPKRKFSYGKILNLLNLMKLKLRADDTQIASLIFMRLEQNLLYLGNHFGFQLVGNLSPSLRLHFIDEIID